MNQTAKNFLAIVLTGLWVNASEFFRNEVLVKSFWLEHYQSIGMTFPSEPLNGMVWMVWGFMLAFAIYIVSRSFDLVQTTLLCWLMAFVLMWIVAWNLGVFPLGLLVYAIPLSLLEIFVGAYLCKKIAH